MSFRLLPELVAEPGHLPVDGQGRADGPLGSVLQGDGGAEQGHDPVAGHLVDRALVVVDLVDEELVDLVHDPVGLFGPESARPGA